jgi:hypothetical protein
VIIAIPVAYVLRAFQHLLVFSYDIARSTQHVHLYEKEKAGTCPLSPDERGERGVEELLRVLVKVE